MLTIKTLLDTVQLAFISNPYYMTSSEKSDETHQKSGCSRVQGRDIDEDLDQNLNLLPHSIRQNERLKGAISTKI